MRQIIDLDKKIIGILKHSKNSISTREIALKTKRSWHSVLRVCLKLKNKGKVDVFNAGRMHLWSIKKR